LTKGAIKALPGAGKAVLYQEPPTLQDAMDARDKLEGDLGKLFGDKADRVKVGISWRDNGKGVWIRRVVAEVELTDAEKISGKIGGKPIMDFLSPLSPVSENGVEQDISIGHRT
jgi:hypothetical protein